STAEPRRDYNCVSLVDNLVDACQHNSRQGDKTESLGRRHVEQRFVGARRQHWKVRWLGAPENLVDIARRAPVLVEKSRPIGKETAILGIEGVRVDGRDPGLGRQGNKIL